MYPLFFGIISSIIFGVTAYTMYGPAVFAQSCWFYLILGSLMATGFLVSLMGEMNHCLPCKMKIRFKNSRWLETLCLHTPCTAQKPDPMIRL
jgi:hypothetical protein